METRRIYCVVPADLAVRLHDLLRRHFLDDPTVEVVVERRSSERRTRPDRRAPGAGAKGAANGGGAERRRVRAAEGRRVAERRAGLVPLPAAEIPPLPRRARRFAERLRFVERLIPSNVATEDADTARLVTAFQAGDETAMSDLYTRYFDRVYGYLRALLRDPHEAEDISQAVFMQVIESIHDYQRRRSPFRAWLFAIARNKAVDHLRKHGRLTLESNGELDRRRETMAEPEPLPFGALSWITDGDLMLFVERLPNPQRQVLALRYMLDLTHAEIASVMGRSEIDVRTLQHRAVRFLEDRLSAIGRCPSNRRPARMRIYTRQAPVLRMRRFSLSP